MSATHININDDVFAQLTDLFGDILSTEIIFNLCSETDWQLNTCIEKLIKHIEDNDGNIFQPIAQKTDITSTNNGDTNPLVNTTNQIENLQLSPFEDEVDCIVESEEIQLPVKSCLSPTAKQFVPLCTVNYHTSEVNQSINLPIEEPSKMSYAFLRNNPGEFDGNYPNGQPTNKNARHSSPLKHPAMSEINDTIKKGYRIMILMRGMPGSGKSHLAREIVSQTIGDDYKNHIFSSDDYFYNRQNQYQYNRTKISDAHDFNKTRVRRRCLDGWSPIIVDNTNTEVWEMYDYVRLAVQNSYLIKILEPNTFWSKSAGRLAMKNVHNVPKDKIEKMLNRYEHTTVKDMLRSLNLGYSGEMPRIRNNPPPPAVVWNCVIGDCSGTTSGNDNKNTNFALSSEPVWNDDWSSPKHSKSISKKDNRKEARIESSENLANSSSKLLNNEPQIWMNNWNGNEKIVENNKEEWSKPARGKNKKQQEMHPEDDFKIAVKQIEKISDEWIAFEKERTDFWSKNVSMPQTAVKSQTVNESQPLSSAPIAHGEQSESHILSILKDSVRLPPEGNCDDSEKDKPKLEKHKKNCPNEDQSFAQIRQIFPHVPLHILWDLFINCDGDPNWTMDILLKEETRIGDYQSNNTVTDFTCNCFNVNKKIPQNIEMPFVPSTNTPTTPVKECRSKKSERNTQTKEELLTMKKMIEENVVIPDEHYSNHTRKIRNIRYGIYPQPSSGYELDEALSTELDEALGAVGGTSDETNESTSEDDVEDLVEINLGMELVSQLDSIFGMNAFHRESITDLKTNVFMPKELAQQLYALWMESLFNQIEEQRQKSIKEDEEFARMLYVQQRFPSGMQPKKTDNYKEVMDMEYAWAAYKAELDNNWKLSSQNDLASHMTVAKLSELFPDVNRDTLHEMLVAHGNNFQETVDVLQKSLGLNPEQNVEESSRILMEKAKAETDAAPQNLEQLRSSIGSSQRSLEMKKLGPDEAKRAALKDFEDCRNMAAHHTQLKAKCYRKAQEVIQRGESAAALYYSQIANLHKTKIDMYNHKAANAIMEVHNLNQNNPDMLDLHYLHVIEAVQCLDIFLDKHITKLKAVRQTYKYIFVITGRGLHSAGGIASIKHKTKSRLRERGLTWAEVNPGLLKVKIHVTSRFTNA